MAETQEKSSGKRERTSLLRMCVAAALFMIFWLGLASFFHGKTGFEKTATRLVTPLGAAWTVLGAFGLVHMLSARGLVRILSPLAWCVFTLCTCSPVVALLTKYIEHGVEHAKLSTQQPLDYVVVLGGGTTMGPDRAQLGSSGDRVMRGAQLYFEGYTNQLITTGESIEGLGGKKIPGPAEQTVELWTKIGIPRADIVTMPGINTYQETKALAEAVLSGPLQDKRIGLVTSATHLPRAIRLAKSHGIEGLYPIPADFRSRQSNYYTIMDFLPSSGALNQLFRNQHEIMAAWVGR